MRAQIGHRSRSRHIDSARPRGLAQPEARGPVEYGCYAFMFGPAESIRPGSDRPIPTTFGDGQGRVLPLAST